MRVRLRGRRPCRRRGGRVAMQLARRLPLLRGSHPVAQRRARRIRAGLRRPCRRNGYAGH
nr:MAG TPA: hypothetical protein [Caudoviricetes sp.]